MSITNAIASLSDKTLENCIYACIAANLLCTIIISIYALS